MDYAASEALVEHVERTPRRAPRRAAEPPSFSEVERSVIHLSQKDPVASIPDLRDWRVAVARLFAVEPAGPLADRRLEELRRFAILVRLHDDPGDDALDRFLDAGYTVEQAGLVHRIVHEGTAVGRRRKETRYVFRAAPMLIALGVSTLFHDAGAIAVSVVVGGFISAIVAGGRFNRA